MTSQYNIYTEFPNADPKAITNLNCRFVASSRGTAQNFPKATENQRIQIVHYSTKHRVLVANSFTLPRHVLLYHSSPLVKVN